MVRQLQSKVLAEPVLVGRKRELAELRALLDLAINGRGNTVFVSGEAGVGKTRLLTEFLKIAKKKEVNVLTGWCLSNAAVPYFPFIEAFNSYFSTNDAEKSSTFGQSMSLKSILTATNQPQENDRLATIVPQTWRDQTFGAVTEELLLLSAKRPLILALEDIHWADSASLSLLHYLARQVGSERILIVATFRNEELGADVEGHPGPLFNTLRLMGRDSLYTEVRLPNLGVADIEGIIDSMLRGCMDHRLAERLALDSRGNPLFVVESLRMLFQQGCLSKKNGRWSLVVEDFGVPPRVKDVILRRIGMLAPNQRRILDVASLVGESFDPKLVAAVVSRENIDVLVDLDKIAKSTMIVRLEGDLYRFNHAKSREILCEEISPILRKEYHSKIAEKIEASSQYITDVMASDLASHYLQASNQVKAVKYSLQAGKFALAQYSNLEAIRHFSYVLSASGDNEAYFDGRMSALEGLGDAFFANSMFKEAMKMYEGLADTPKTCAIKLRALRKAIKSSILFGDKQHAKELVKKAEQCAAADRLETARILMNKAMVDPGHNIDGILKDYIVALRVFEEEYSLLDVASALFVVGSLNTRLGKPQEGLAKSLRSVSLFEELGDFRSQMEACFFAGLTFSNCLLSTEAFEMFVKIMEIDEKTKMGDYLRLSDANVFSSRLLASSGEFFKALQYGLKALELSKKTDSVQARGMVHSILTVVYTRLGDLKRAEEHFNELMKLPPEIFNKGSFVGTITAQSVFFAGKNQWEESNRCFDEYFKLLERDPAPAASAAQKEMYAWALEKQGRKDEAKSQLEEAEKIRREANERFEHVSVQAHLIANAKVRLGQTFEARFDIVNVSRARGLLVHIENLVDPKLDIAVFPKICTIRNDMIDMNKEEIQPFQVKTIRLCFQAKQQGKINLNPRVTYVDDLGKTGTSAANKVTIVVQAPEASTEEASFSELPQIEFKFKSDSTQKAYDFLIKAFWDDYNVQRLPGNDSGWRTLLAIVKGAHVSKHSMYGRAGRCGAVTSELERLGLVESRLFPGERGRGGRVVKLRFCGEKGHEKRQFG